jgi:hypothetical protein
MQAQKSPNEPSGRIAVPGPQRSYDEATARALSAVRVQPAEQLRWLGASPAGEAWTIPVLDDVWTVELKEGTVHDSSGRPVGPWWRVLTLHYLGISGRPGPGLGQKPPTVTFADLSGGRGYSSVYQQRVIARLCRTVGRDGHTLRRAAETIGGEVLRDAAEGIVSPDAPPGGDLMIQFQIFPRLRVGLAWYGGDEELSPLAALLLPANVEAFFCLEDIVVLSEQLVARLAKGRVPSQR